MLLTPTLRAAGALALALLFAALSDTALAQQVAHQTVDNPYGIEAMWKAGDFVTRFVLIAMIIMSLGSWYIIFTK
ncbi:MotA/TolQ/ExbB proton channel family protein, partial [Ideonella sp. BN130291]|nr:MotA/TolQ/ExbB proton channel family protein [Ideonella sp. BN130291]